MDTKTTTAVFAVTLLSVVLLVFVVSPAFLNIVRSIPSPVEEVKYKCRCWFKTSNLVGYSGRGFWMYGEWDDYAEGIYDDDITGNQCKVTLPKCLGYSRIVPYRCNNTGTEEVVKQWSCVAI